MNPFFKSPGHLRVLGAVLWAGSSLVVWAQASSATSPAGAHVHGSASSVSSTAVPSVTSGTPLRSWQDANRDVAQFPRGHIDVLRWEQKNQLPSHDALPPPDAGQLTLERATRLVFQDEPKWLKPGMSAMDAAEVRQQVSAVRRDVQKLWVDAVASRQSVAHSRDILAVAEVAAELGQRMTQVGNWSRARQIQEELPLWAARMRLDKAQLQADRALQALWQRVGAGMTVQALAQQLPAHLPTALPPVPGVNSGQAPSDVLLDLQTLALQAHLRWPLEDLQARRLMAGLGLSGAEQQAAQKALSEQIEQGGQGVPVWDPRSMRWGHALENAWQVRLQADRMARQVRADVTTALQAFELARQTSRHTQSEVLRLHTELSQQTLLRYNGMLKSTWDLLASARTRIDSVDAALQAQRQVWLAHADLMAVLAGLPYADSTRMADTAISSPQTAGH
jgi:hypothetical protein